MNYFLKNYLHQLLNAGIGLGFSSAVYSYGKFTIYCIIGPEENIIHLTFARQRHELACKRLACLDSSVAFEDLEQQDFPYSAIFKEYFTGKLPVLPFAINSPFIGAGTQFQQKVWHRIAAIPYGNCITYQELAESTGSPKGVRAAGTACGANPLALIIPCHRVKALNGPGGFAGGPDIKKSLLALEHAGASCM